MAALLVGLSVMSVMMAVALPVWSHANRREREEELIWRGEQYKRAIMLFQRKYANTFPPNIDILVEQRFLRKKYKDPITGEDFQVIPVGGPGAGPGALPGGRQGGGGPGSGGFGQTVSGPPVPGGQGSMGQQSLPPGSGIAGLGGVGGGTPGTQPAMGIQGVTSKSRETSIKRYNGMDKYNQWAFVYLAASNQAGTGGTRFSRPGETDPNSPGLFGNTPGGPGGGIGVPPGGIGGGGLGGPRGPGGQVPFGQPATQPKYPPVPGGPGRPGPGLTPGAPIFRPGGMSQPPPPR